MRNIIYSLMLASAPCVATDFSPELFNVDKVDSIVAGSVLVNEDLKPGLEVSRFLYKYGKVDQVLDTGEWKNLASIFEVERYLGDQVPLHLNSLSKIKQLKSPTYWIFQSKNEEASFNRYLYVVSENKVQLISFWKQIKGDNPSGVGSVFLNSKNAYEIDTSIRNDLDKLMRNRRSSPYFGESGYRQDQALAIGLNSAFATELTSAYPEYGTPGPSFTAPYLWGKYFILSPEYVDIVYKANTGKHQSTFTYDDFRSSFYNTIEEYEQNIGAHIPLRFQQTNWIKQVGQDYYILHTEQKEGESHGYNNVLYFHTVKEHKPFMTILLNSKDYYQE